jgi:predicted nucleotidyltransferase
LLNIVIIVHEVNDYIKELFSRCLISKNNVSKIINTALEARPSYNTVKYRLHNVVMETKKEMLAIGNYEGTVKRGWKFAIWNLDF